MHGTGLFNAMWTLASGRFDRHHGRPALRRRRAARHGRARAGSTAMSIVGDAFAKPILRALDAEPDRWDISSLRVIVSSGVIWSSQTKAGLLRHNDRLIMVDSLGSSRGDRHGASTTTRRTRPTRRRRSSSARTPGSSPRTAARSCRARGERGLVALRGRTPVGYYKDPRPSRRPRSSRIDGVRYSIPGDFADGRRRRHRAPARPRQPVHQHRRREGLPGGGRGGAQAAPDRGRRRRRRRARRALRRGRSPRSSSPHAGDTIDEAALIAHVKEHLAAYKAPKRVITVDTVGPRRQRQARLQGARSKALDDLGLA